MLEGFDSKCFMNFEGFTNPASEPRTTLHKTHCGFTVLFLTMEVKPISNTLQNACVSSPRQQ